MSGRPFRIALTGGRTTRRLYEVLGAEYPGRQWSGLDCWWSDERLVRRDDPESNYRGVWAAWLSPARVPPAQLHPPDVSLSDPAEVARRYEKDVRGSLGPGLVFDCVLLSLGEDGHVASLFPGRREVREATRLVVPVVDSPKPPRRRVTMTLALINRATVVHVLAAGPDKAEALRSVLHGDANGADTRPRPPAAAIRPLDGRVVWWADEGAAGRLPPGATVRR